MKNARIVATRNLMPVEYLDQLFDEENTHYVDVASRDDTSTIYIVDTENGKLQAYAVVGEDQDGFYMIYAAHCFMKGLGKIAMASMFGAAKIMGKPLRVHSTKIRAMASMFGAPDFMDAVDTDGIPQGVFHG